MVFTWKESRSSRMWITISLRDLWQFGIALFCCQDNTMALANDNPVGRDADSLLAAGDSRANVQPGLIALHTLFAREHNRLCDVFKKKYPQVSWKYLSNKIDITESTVWEERSLLKFESRGTDICRWILYLNPRPSSSSQSKLIIRRFVFP